MAASSPTSASPAAFADRLIVDFQDIREYRQAVEIARASGHTLLLATPRIQKPDEMGLFRAIFLTTPSWSRTT
jgi:putative protease